MSDIDLLKKVCGQYPTLVSIMGKQTDYLLQYLIERNFIGEKLFSFWNVHCGGDNEILIKAMYYMIGNDLNHYEIRRLTREELSCL